MKHPEEQEILKAADSNYPRGPRHKICCVIGDFVNAFRNVYPKQLYLLTNKLIADGKGNLPISESGIPEIHKLWLRHKLDQYRPLQVETPMTIQQANTLANEIICLGIWEGWYKIERITEKDFRLQNSYIQHLVGLGAFACFAATIFAILKMATA